MLTSYVVSNIYQTFGVSLIISMKNVFGIFQGIEGKRHTIVKPHLYPLYTSGIPYFISDMNYDF